MTRNDLFYNSAQFRTYVSRSTGHLTRDSSNFGIVSEPGSFPLHISQCPTMMVECRSCCGVVTVQQPTLVGDIGDVSVGICAKERWTGRVRGAYGRKARSIATSDSQSCNSLAECARRGNGVLAILASVGLAHQRLQIGIWDTKFQTGCQPLSSWSTHETLPLWRQVPARARASTRLPADWLSTFFVSSRTHSADGTSIASDKNHTSGPVHVDMRTIVTKAATVIPKAVIL